MLSKLKKLGIICLLPLSASCYSRMHKPDQYAMNNSTPAKAVQVQEDIYSHDKDMITLLEGLISEEMKKSCRNEKLDIIFKDKLKQYNSLNKKPKKTGSDYITLLNLESEVESLNSFNRSQASDCVNLKQEKIDDYKKLIIYYKERKDNDKLF